MAILECYSMNASTVIALAGISGTLVAGLGGTYLGALLERRAERRREGVAIRRAARLIDADLLFAEICARVCVEQKRWWVSDRRLTSDGWQQHRDVIASALRWDDWVAVMVAIEAVGDLQGSRDAALRIQLAELAIDPNMRDVLAAAESRGLDIADPDPTMPEARARQIEPMLAHLVAGRAALSALVRTAEV